MSVKLHIKKGDMVYVNAGDSKGQQGKVLKVDAQKQRAIVEGVNISKKATKPNAKNPQGWYHRTGVGDPHFESAGSGSEEAANPPRIGRKQNAAGKLVRFAKSQGRRSNNGSIRTYTQDTV